MPLSSFPRTQRATKPSTPCVVDSTLKVDCCASGVQEDHGNEADLQAEAIDPGSVLIKAVLYDVAMPGATFVT